MRRRQIKPVRRPTELKLLLARPDRSRQIKTVRRPMELKRMVVRPDHKFQQWDRQITSMDQRYQ